MHQNADQNLLLSISYTEQKELLKSEQYNESYGKKTELNVTINCIIAHCLP